LSFGRLGGASGGDARAVRRDDLAAYFVAAKAFLDVWA
jgi:hypothetical protein